MDEADQYHPARLTIFADGFGGLQEMLHLAEICIRVAVVYERVEVFCCLPNALFVARKPEVLLLFAQDVIEGLPLVIGTIELGYARIRLGIILAILGFSFYFFVSHSNEAFPPLNPIVIARRVYNQWPHGVALT